MELSANDIDQLRACVNGNLEFHEEAVRLSSYCLCLWQVLPNDNSCNNWCPSGKGERNIIGIKEASSNSSWLQCTKYFNIDLSIKRFTLCAPFSCLHLSSYDGLFPLRYSRTKRRLEEKRKSPAAWKPNAYVMSRLCAISELILGFVFTFLISHSSLVHF